MDRGWGCHGPYAAHYRLPPVGVVQMVVTHVRRRVLVGFI